MKHKSIITSLTILLVLFLGIGRATAQEPAPGGDIGPQATVGTSFTYQGRLTDGGSPANGEYDFRFRLYDAASDGTHIGTYVDVPNVQVTDGLFTARINSGPGIFTGEARYLQIEVRPGDSYGTYTALTPRQELTPAPYAHTLRPGASIVDSLDMDGILHVTNNSETGDGLQVWAGDDGVYVYSAGSPSTTSSSTYHNGFEVAGAEGHGLYIGQADCDGVSVNSAGDDGVEVLSAGDDGVYVQSADDDGVYVYSANNDGVYVYSASDDGVYVRSAGNPSTTSLSPYHNGFEVAGAEGHGLYIGQADRDGVHVNSTGGEGVHVRSAGSPSTTIPSIIYKNGFQVDGAEGHGLYVGRADRHGVCVHSAGGDAGYFGGNVTVTGNLSKSSGSFKIDHPLDPENQYLYHSLVESPDMMNVYNGNVTLDDNREAWITLPDWFEALNRDFRYQLTPIGGPGPNLYIAREIRDNRFQIAGGTPGLKVSWQVTGIRHDPYAEANRIPVEEEKPAEEQGTYLHPEAYGQPETIGLAYKEAQAHEANQPAAGR